MVKSGQAGAGAPPAGQLLDHRVLGLPAHPASARLARRLVKEVLREAVADEVLDTAQLLVSEIVTNAVVHARSDIGLTVSLVRDFVRVEVADHSPHLPVVRQREQGTATGHGLDVVAALAADFGVVAHAAGKAVWFTLGNIAAPEAPAGRTAAAGFARRDALETGVPLVDVTLLGVPVELYCRWHEQVASVLREQLLIHLDNGGSGDERAADERAVDERAADEIAVVNAALTQLAQVTEPAFQASMSQAMGGAVADSQGRLDLAFRLPAGLFPRFGVLREVLEDAPTLPEQHVLLAPARRPDVGALQRWCCRELLRQASGLEPVPWPS